MKTKVKLFSLVLGALLISTGCSTAPEGGRVYTLFGDNGVRDLSAGEAKKPGSKNFVKAIVANPQYLEENGISLSAKNESAKITVILYPPVNCFTRIEVINEGNSLARILWDQSSLSLGSGNAERPIPFQQVKAGGNIAPSTAVATVIPPGGKFADSILSLDKISTETSYSSIYQGGRYVGSIANGTYVDIKQSMACEYTDYAQRAKIQRPSLSDSSRNVEDSEPMESWEARVIQNAEAKYLNKPLNALITVETGGVIHPLQFSFVAKSFKVISHKAQLEAESKKK